MKKKALIIIPVIIIVAFIIIIIPKSIKEDSIPETTATTEVISTPTEKPTPIPSPTPNNEASKIDNIEAETQDEIEYDNYLQEVESEHNKDESDVAESDIESLDKIMYAQGNVNTRSGPSQDFEKVGGLSVNQEVKVTGKSKETGWYEIEVNGSKQYVSDKFLADSKITVTTSNTENAGNTGNTNSNPVSNDVLPGENTNWSGGDGDAASIFNSLPSVGSAPGSGDYSGGAGIHAE